MNTRLFCLLVCGALVFVSAQAALQPVSTTFLTRNLDGAPDVNFNRADEFYSPMEPAGWYHGTNVANGFEWAENNGGKRPVGGIYAGGNTHSGNQALFFEGVGAYGEVKYVEFTTTIDFASINTPQAIAAGDTVTWSAWLKFDNLAGTNGNQDVYLGMRFRDAGNNEVSYQDQGLTHVSDWTKFELSGTVAASATKVELIVKYMAWGDGFASGTAYVDDFSAIVTQMVDAPVVPEPASYAGLAGLAIMFWAAFRRRFQRR